MNLKGLLTQATWLWLPLFLAGCIAVGFYRSYAAPADPAAVSCPGGSQLDRFLGCP
ncbi:MAG TPA: hypothetical protein VGE14_03165 [Marmoricola sp.]